MDRTRWRAMALGIVWLAAALGGCQTPRGPATIDVAPGHYPRAFDAAKDTLRRAGFTLDRVDAARGIITTRHEPSAGFLTPWDTHAQTLGDAWRGTVQPERRRVEVRFEPLPSPDAEPTHDLRAYQGPLTGRVAVTLLRLHRPWRRLDATSIRFSSLAIDPVEARQGESGVREHDAGTDPALASRLARGIRDLAARRP